MEKLVELLDEIESLAQELKNESKKADLEPSQQALIHGFTKNIVENAEIHKENFSKSGE